MVSRQRDSCIELYRICLMFGICLLHCVCQGKWNGIWPRNLLGFCVPGFVFITGYFGVCFSVSKIIRLYSIPIYASLIAPLCGGAARHEYLQEVLRVWDADGGFWFIHAYVLLMVLAPFINAMFKMSTAREQVMIVLPVLVAVMGWGALLNYNILRTYIPSSPGLVGESVLTFVGIYCVGRFFKLHQIDERISTNIALIFSIMLGVVISLASGYLCHTNNVLSLALSILLFVVFKHLRLTGVAEKVVCWVSPFMLSVYCISGTVYFPFTGPKFFSIIEFAKSSLYENGLNIYFSIIFSAVISFITSIVLALPLYGLSKVLNPILSKMYKMFDDGFIAMCNRISNGFPE